MSSQHNSLVERFWLFISIFFVYFIRHARNFWQAKKKFYFPVDPNSDIWRKIKFFGSLPANGKLFKLWITTHTHTKRKMHHTHTHTKSHTFQIWSSLLGLSNNEFNNNFKNLWTPLWTHTHTHIFHCCWLAGWLAVAFHKTSLLNSVLKLIAFYFILTN